MGKQVGWFLAVSSVVLVCGSGMAWGGILLNEPFDGYATGFPPVPPWPEFYEGGMTRPEAAAQGVTISIDDSVSVSGKSVHFLDTSASVGCMLSRELAPSTSIVLEYYMRSDNRGYEGAFVVLRGDASTDYSVGFRGNNAGYIGIHGWSGGWVVPNLLSYTADSWYFVRRTLDLTTNQGNFYVEEVGNPLHHASWSIGSNYPNTYVNEVDILTSTSQGADAYIDNMTATPEPASMSLLALAGLAVLRRRRK